MTNYRLLQLLGAQEKFQIQIDSILYRPDYTSLSIICLGDLVCYEYKDSGYFKMGVVVGFNTSSEDGHVDVISVMSNKMKSLGSKRQCTSRSSIKCRFKVAYSIDDTLWRLFSTSNGHQVTILVCNNPKKLNRIKQDMIEIAESHAAPYEYRVEEV